MKKTLSRLGIAAAVAKVFGVFASGQKTWAASQNRLPQTVEVKSDNFSFAPAKLTISAGAKVTWTNRDNVPHTLISADKAFASPVLDEDEKFSFTFIQPGIYPYYCSNHPKMTAKIVVQ